MLQRIFCLVAVTLSLANPLIDAFTAACPPTASTTTSSTTLFVSRRVVLETSMTAIMGSLLTVSPVFAEGFEDLSMPSEAEQQQSEEDAMKERLRRKAELQKAMAKPASFKESMEVERKKQESLKKSKEERRNALCEELGRGC